MVGMKATRSPSRRQACTCSRTAAIVVTVSKRGIRDPQKLCSGAGYSRDFTART